MFSSRDPWAVTQACSRLGTTPTTRARCLWNNWFHLLQLSALHWAFRWCLSSDLCKPSAPAHFIRRSPEAWYPYSFFTRPQAWWRPGMPSSKRFDTKCWQNDLILWISLKFEFITKAPGEWAIWSMNLQQAACLKPRGHTTTYSKIVSPNSVTQIL